MTVGNPFTITSFFYIVLLVVVYFCKPRIRSDETRLYRNITITCLIGVCLSFGTFYFMANMDKYPFLNFAFARGYLLFILCFTFFMTQYVFLLAFNGVKYVKKHYKSVRYLAFWISTFLFLAFGVVSIFLPIEYHNANNLIYSSGPAVEFIYFITRSMLMIWIVVLSIRFKKIQFKKCLPMIAYVVL